MSKMAKIKGVERGRSLEGLTTFAMGGPADWFVELKEAEPMPELVERAIEEGLPWLILGWGSNMILSDRGWRGLVVHNLARRVEMDGDLVVAESGTLLSQIIQFALKEGRTGMEKLMGLPGTIGGAVRGNAGAFGLEAKDLVEKVLVWGPERGMREVGADEVGFEYRHSRLKESGELILKVWLRLEKGDVEAGVAEVRKIIASRVGKHPWGKSAGSFFKNPSGNSVGEGWSAGYLSDQCGFKGYKVGGAYISEKHANFLMNDGTARMEDVLELGQRIVGAVEQKFGVRLEREVQLFGEKGKIA